MDLAKNIKTYRIVISGYYGFRNSGDEAVLRSILLALEKQSEQEGVSITPVVLSSDPAWTKEMYGVEAVDRMNPKVLWNVIKGSDGLISGGGSLLQDATGVKSIPYYTGVIKIAQILRKPTFIYAQGIGPVNRKWMFPFISSAMKKSAYVSVRDIESAKLLQSMGVSGDKIEIVPDPVMGMPLPLHHSKKQEDGNIPVVGVSVRSWREDSMDLKAVGESLVELTKRMPVRIVFLPFHTPDDTEASTFVINQIQNRLASGSSAEIAKISDDPQEMLLAVGRCQLLFGMRLHALIYAANQRVPLLGLSYDPKINQFLSRLQLQPVGTTEALDKDQFAEQACTLLNYSERWKLEKEPLIKQLVEQSQQPAQQISRFLRHNISR